MMKHTDQVYLLTEEYENGWGLVVRIQIQENFNTNSYEWFQWVFDQLDLPAKSCILELGCGPGTLWTENLDRLPEDWDITLSDLSPGMLQEAQQNLSHSQRHFTFQVADTQLVPFADGYFHAVIANGILDHVPDTGEAFKQIHRVLKPGGHLYASAGGQAHLQELEKLVKPFIPDVSYGGEPERFGLENGLTQLAEWFPGAALHRYRDELVFREVEPIIAYILSEGWVRSILVGEKRAELIRFLEQELARQSEIRVTIDKGLFKAYKGLHEYQYESYHKF